MTSSTRPGRRDAGRPRGTPVVDAVLSATIEELAEVGLEALSVERVARRAEVNKTSVYRRWPTREDLATAALDRLLSDVARIPDTGSLRGDLAALLDQVAALVSGSRGRALVRVAFSDAMAPAVAALATRQIAEQAASPASGLADRARARGEWRAGVSPDQLVFTLVGAAIHRALLEHRELSPSWRDQLVELVLLGAVPRDDPAGPGGEP